MKTIVLIATLIFWCGIAAILVLGGSGRELPAISAKSGQPEQTSAVTTYSLADVARHGSAESCWMAIHGKVYDVTAYAPHHPSNPAVFQKYCGREATIGFDTKDRGRPHSSTAKRRLEEFYIGELVGRSIN